MVEYNCQMSLGLCLHCGQSGHLIRLCLKQVRRNPAILGARVAYIEPSATIPEEREKEEIVVLLPRELIA